METIKVTPERLYNIAYKYFLKMGLSDEDAAQAADVLNLSDRRGVYSHGLNNIKWYSFALEHGIANPKAELTILREEPSMLYIDCNAGLGIAQVPKAMKLVVEKAKETGICVAALTHSGHFGMAAYYSLMAAEHGLFGWASAGGCQCVVPTGGKKAVLANSPWSAAFPAGEKYSEPVLTDMATSAVAIGKIDVARKNGTKIPFGWALDKDGLPTDDPVAFYESHNLMPFGGPKGYCVTVMVEMLSAVVSGAGFDGDVPFGPYDRIAPENHGQFLMAMDLSRFRPMEEITKDIDRYADMLHNCPKAVNADRIYAPGEIEAINMHKSDAEGVDFGVYLLKELLEIMIRDGALPEGATIDDLLNM